MPNFFDGSSIVALSKQPANYRLLNRRFRTHEGLSLVARITALLGQKPGTAALDETFYLDVSYLDSVSQIQASFTQVQAQTPVPVNWTTNAHRLYGGVVPITSKTIIDRPSTISDVYDLRSLVKDNELPPIKSYRDGLKGSTTDGVRYNTSGSLLGIGFRLGSSRLGGNSLGG